MDLKPWLTKGGSYLRARARWAAVFGLIALALRASLPTPPPRSAEGVAAMLGAAVGGEVRPDDFVWEERGGFFHDAFLGRRVLFLARRPDGGMGDLFRAQVRLTRAGRPVSLALVRNLTESPIGDDRELLAHGHFAAYLTMSGGAVAGITLLDLNGEDAPRDTRTRREKLGAALENWLVSGSTRGIGRTEISFGAPGKPDADAAAPAEAKLELEGDLLVLALGKEALPAALDLRDGQLNVGPQNAFAARVQRIPHLTRPLAEVAIDALGAVGAAMPARALRALVGVPRKSAPHGPLQVFPGRAPPPPSPPVEGEWPPPPLSPPVHPALPGEGRWAKPLPDFANAGADAQAPSAFFETAIRPEPRRPEALVRLVALDLRQLDLRLEAGFDAPRPATGIRGVGRLPAEGPIVAAFAAGPAQPAGRLPEVAAPGFVVDRRVVVPLVANAATVVMGRDGLLSFGDWGPGALPLSGIAAAWQAPDAILGGDGHARIPLVASGVSTERSALCRLGSGQMIYAWGADVDVDTMARALSLAGCTYALHLAAGPAPTGFTYLRAPIAAAPIAAAPNRWDAALLAPEMSLSPTALTGADGASPNAFFYLVRRDPHPTAPLPAAEVRRGGAAAAEGDAPSASWAPDGGQQPTPAWIPAIYQAVVSNLGAQVHVTSFAPGRLLFRLRAGSKEPSTKAGAALPGALDEGEQGRALAVIGIGSGRKRGVRGLAIGGTVGYPFRAEARGVLMIDKGLPRIVLSAGFTPAPGADATELPLTADEGKLRPEARDVGSMRPRASACVLADGTFVVGSTTFDSDEAATGILLELGCSRVVALDRGAHGNALLARAGTETPPSARYEVSALYAIDAPLRGRAGLLGSD